MIANPGSSVKVRVFLQDRSGIVDMQAVITSEGPPGVVAVWARTVQPGRWLLVRKAPDGTLYAVEGDRGIVPPDGL